MRLTIIEPARARSVRISRYIGIPSISSSGIEIAGHHQASLMPPRAAPLPMAIRSPSPLAPGAPTGASIGPRRNDLTSCGLRSKPPLASTTASAFGSSRTRVPGPDLHAGIQAGGEQTGDQGPPERQRAALPPAGHRLAVDLAPGQFQVGDRAGDVRRRADHGRDLGRWVERSGSSVRPPAPAAGELGVVVAVRDRLQAHRSVTLQARRGRSRLTGEDLDQLVVDVADRQGPQVGEGLLRGVVGEALVRRQPGICARQRGRPAECSPAS